MSELQNDANAEFDKSKEIQTALKNYGTSIEGLALEYPVQQETPPIYETPNYDIEELDGHPLEISYSYYPEGMENYPNVRYTTIVIDRVEQLGKWVKNYHIHEAYDGKLAWEKVEWFIADSHVLEALKKGDGLATLSEEISPKAALSGMNLADQKAYIANLSEALSNFELEVPDINELTMLQGYIDQLT